MGTPTLVDVPMIVIRGSAFSVIMTRL